GGTDRWRAPCARRRVPESMASATGRRSPSRRSPPLDVGAPPNGPPSRPETGSGATRPAGSGSAAGRAGRSPHHVHRPRNLLAAGVRPESPHRPDLDRAGGALLAPRWPALHGRGHGAGGRAAVERGAAVPWTLRPSGREDGADAGGAFRSRTDLVHTARLRAVAEAPGRGARGRAGLVGGARPVGPVRSGAPHLPAGAPLEPARDRWETPAVGVMGDSRCAVGRRASESGKRPGGAGRCRIRVEAAVAAGPLLRRRLRLLPGVPRHRTAPRAVPRVPAADRRL